jgi:DNA-binding CsgD family transcriptional regulator
MGISISSALATAAADYATQNSASAAAPVQNQNNAGDTVQLTAAQQVYNLYNEGQTVSQIAFNLNLPVPLVNNYLGITNSGT